jgi:hypothetical protein
MAVGTMALLRRPYWLLPAQFPFALLQRQHYPVESWDFRARNLRAREQRSD